MLASLAVTKGAELFCSNNSSGEEARAKQVCRREDGHTPNLVLF